jgi:hypothetical protein
MHGKKLSTHSEGSEINFPVHWLITGRFIGAPAVILQLIINILIKFLSLWRLTPQKLLKRF